MIKCAGLALINSKSSEPLSALDDVSDSLSKNGIFISRAVFADSHDEDGFLDILKALSGEFEYVFIAPPRVAFFSLQGAVAKATGGDGHFYYATANGGVFILPLEKPLREDLLKNNALKIIAAKSKAFYGKTVIKAFCVDGEKIESTLAKAKKLAGNYLEINSFESCLDYHIEIIYNNLTPKMLTDDIIRLINSELFEFIYSLDGQSLETALFDILQVRKLVLSTAESFTGGRVLSSLIAIPGASALVFEGITAYSNKSKVERLAVSQSTLNAYGAVSDECAYEMACSLLQSGNCNVAIATTGIAGPNSDNTDKPKGLCYIAVGYGERVEVFKYRFNGDRETVTQTAVNAAMYLAIKKIRIGE